MIFIKKVVLSVLIFSTLVIGVESEKFNIGVDKERFEVGFYSEFPLSNGISVDYEIKDDLFFKLRYGYSPKYYMQALGNILTIYDWWNSTYTNLLVELCTGMKGLEFGFGTSQFLGKENLIANAGVTLYTLDYNSLSNETLNDVFGTSIEEGREIKVKGKLVALHFNFAKRIPLNRNFVIQPSFNISYINSFYGTIYSELDINDSLSYKLNNWLRSYLEGLFLPTFMLEMKYTF